MGVVEMGRGNNGVVMDSIVRGDCHTGTLDTDEIIVANYNKRSFNH